ncbi:hypothetical protein SEPCBS119000_001303 [Sporothrix epigloea]|uniref:WLM domain-containing protein n=1 Tax=Sporothrix epigloea TaxID=1892477 RepID=A0ABP0DBL8_9PEZI
MPVGIQRLNARRSQPNPHIVFIKPLKGPDEEIARQFLERIAAQCVPIMREHSLSVMTLEEYEPNREFVGRNFNAGEVIQLVLKAQGAGHRWLPFQYVQMVMMHELAHCRQMNHSRAFWAVRDAYAAHMRRLWADKYAGEGIWGRGAMLGTADGSRPLYERNVAVPGDDPNDGVLLEHLCGGTYQSRNGRRKRKVASKPALTYREREDRRIRRKFGVNGEVLGDDLDERARLETATATRANGNKAQSSLGGSGTVGIIKGKTVSPLAGATKTAQKRLAAKPRVANSKRGRDLRAAAALARLEQSRAEAVKEERSVKEEIEQNQETGATETIDLDFTTDSDGDDEDAKYVYEDDPDQPALVGPDAIDIDGKALLDGHGGSMVRVCEGRETGDRADAEREMRELLQMTSPRPKPMENVTRKLAIKQGSAAPKKIPAPSSSCTVATPPEAKTMARPGPSTARMPVGSLKREPVKVEQQEALLSQMPQVGPVGSCPICSFANSGLPATCTMCGHVMQADAVPGTWLCRSSVCRTGEGTRFLNAGDCGVCGVCGQRREQL